MKCFQSLDFFGPPFNFTLFNEEKYKTSIGGFLSLTSFIISIVLLFVIGSEFFFRENPKILISNEKPNKYEIVNINKNDLLIAWKIADKNGNKVNISNKIYPFIYYFNIQKSSLSNKIIQSNKIQLNYSICNITTKSEYDSLWDFNNYYCINYDNYSFGGDIENDELHYFGIYLSYCEDGGDYSLSESKCISLDILKDIGKKEWYFEFIYPEFYFKPDDEGNPLKITYSKYKYQLSVNLQRKDEFNFHKVISRDDQGIITSSIKENQKYAFFSHEYQYILKNDEELFEEKRETFFYFLSFYLIKDISKYNRSFMKIPDLTAMVGTLIKIEIFFFSILSNFFGKILREADIIERYISFKPERKAKIFDLSIKPIIFQSNIQKFKKNNIIDLYKNRFNNENTNDNYINNENSNYKLNHILSNSSEILNDSFNKYGNKINNKFINRTDINREINEINNLNNQNIYYKISNNKIKNNNKLKNPIIKNNKKFQSNKLKAKKNYQSVIENKNFFFEKISKKLLNLPLIIKYYFLPCKKFIKKSKQSKELYQYNLARKYILKVLDFSYYINLNKEIKFLEKIILQYDYRKTAIQYIRNPNINNEDELINYFGIINLEQEIEKFQFMIEQFKLKNVVLQKNREKLIPLSFDDKIDEMLQEKLFYEIIDKINDV